MKALLRRGLSVARADSVTPAVVVTAFVSMVAAAALSPQPYTPGELGLLAALCGLYLYLDVDGWALCERTRSALLTAVYFGAQLALTLAIGLVGRGSGGYWILLFPLRRPGLGSGGAPAGGAQPRARGPRRGRPERRRRGGATDAHQHLVRRTRHLSSSSSLFASGTCGSILACLA